MRHTYSGVLAVAMIASMALVVPSSVCAEPSNWSRYKPTTPTAVTRFEAGNRAFKEARIATRPLADRVRDLKRALAEYTAGQALEDCPAFDYNIATAAALLDDKAAAVEHLQRFLDRAQPPPDASLRQSIEDEIGDLDPSGAIRRQLKSEHTPAAQERTSPPPSGPRGTVAPTVPRVLVPTPGTEPPVTAISTGTAPRESRVWTRLGWGLTVAGVVGGGVATWLAVSAGQLDDDAKDTHRTISDRLDRQSQADSRRHAAVIVGVGSGTAVVLGVVAIIVGSRVDASASGTAWNLRVTGHSIAVLGRF